MNLGWRDVELRELMDDPDCDPARLRRTYAQFASLNRLLSGWRGIYRRQIRPLLSPGKPTTLLDIGSGGGDIARGLARRAARDGLRLSITAIDPDERAHAYATDQPAVPGVVFHRASTADLVAERARFDVVVSNHLLHHLEAPELSAVLDDSRQLARRLVLHNDIARSRAAYVGYAVVSLPVARGSFLRVDGLRSIRRSYRPAELAATAGAPWRVQRAFPARVLLTSSGTIDP